VGTVWARSGLRRITGESSGSRHVTGCCEMPVATAPLAMTGRGRIVACRDRLGTRQYQLEMLLALDRELLLRCVPDGAVPGHRRSLRNRRSRGARRAVQLVPHDAPARASSLRHAQGDDLGPASRRKQRGPAGGSPAVVKIASPVWRSASSLGAGRRRRWMPDMLASSPTCSVEGLMDDLA
jgi:hypothetical protein